METWLLDSTFRKTKKEFSGKVASELQRRLKNEWDEAKIKPINHNTGKESAKPVRLKEIVVEFVATFDPHDQVARKNRNLVIGELRNCLAKVAVDFLEPDLIVLDEFQRFSEILEECIDRNSVVGRLFARQRVAALILSATPYKWYTLAYEKEDHHKDFIRTLKFLFKCVKEEDSDPNYKPIKRLRENLQQFKDRLMKGEWFKEPDEMLIKLKMDIESDLKAVMCRTERNWYLEGRKKGVEEFGEAPLNVNPSICEFSHYIRLRSFLLGQKIDDWNITDFWKSAPSPLTFMDGHYAL